MNAHFTQKTSSLAKKDTIIQIPHEKELKALKPSDLPNLGNLDIKWRQWSTGVYKLQGSAFSEICFTFGNGKQKKFSSKNMLDLNERDSNGSD